MKLYGWRERVFREVLFRFVDAQAHERAELVGGELQGRREAAESGSTPIKSFSLALIVEHQHTIF